MKTNTHYYLSMDANFNITSGQCDFECMSDEDLKVLSDALADPLRTGSLFTGEHVQPTSIKKWDMRKKQLTETIIVKAPANLPIDDNKNFIRMINFNTDLNELKVWVCEKDYKKKSSGPSIQQEQANLAGDGMQF